MKVLEYLTLESEPAEKPPRVIKLAVRELGIAKAVIVRTKLNGGIA